MVVVSDRPIGYVLYLGLLGYSFPPHLTLWLPADIRVLSCNRPDGRRPKKSFTANSVQYSAAKGKYSYGTLRKSARFLS